MLNDASLQAEKKILGAIPYQENSCVFASRCHCCYPNEISLGSMELSSLTNQTGMPIKLHVTYNMNILQNLQSPEPILVTLKSH